MRYAKIREYDVSNGPGVRTTLFVSGCYFNCKGCFNKDAQDFNYGSLYTKETEDYFIKITNNKNIVGVNILGGEPMQQDEEIILNLVRRIKEETKKEIWCWTGYTFEELIKNDKKIKILKYIDVLVDGQFIENKKDLMLKYKGSSNQRVIDVKESLLKNTIIKRVD